MEIIKKILGQTSWQILGKIISAFSTIFVLAIISRTYGKQGVGIYTLALTYLATFFLFIDLGLNGYLLPRIKNDNFEFNKLLGFRLRAGFLVTIMAFVGLFILPLGGIEFNLSVMFGLVTILCYGIFNTVNLIFQKNLRYEYSNIASGSGALIILPVVYLLSLLHSPIYLLAIGPLVGWLINDLVAVLLVSQFVKIRPVFSAFKSELILLKNIWPIALTLVLNTIYFRVDSFILSFYHGYEAVGIYNYAYQFFQTAITLPTFVMNGFYPLLLKAFENNRDIFRRQVFIGSLILFGIAILGMFATFLISPILLPLISGTGFEESIRTLNILAISFPAYFVSALLMWAIMVLKKYRSLFFCYLIGVIVNIILNLWFIPNYSYLAAASITGISEYLILLLQVIILLKAYKQR